MPVPAVAYAFTKGYGATSRRGVVCAALAPGEWEQHHSWTALRVLGAGPDGYNF